jgi:hypothetical protein
MIFVKTSCFNDVGPNLILFLWCEWTTVKTNEVNMPIKLTKESNLPLLLHKTHSKISLPWLFLPQFNSRKQIVPQTKLSCNQGDLPCLYPIWNKFINHHSVNHAAKSVFRVAITEPGFNLVYLSIILVNCSSSSIVPCTSYMSSYMDTSIVDLVSICRARACCGWINRPNTTM